MEMNSANVEAVVKQVLESMLEKKVPEAAPAQKAAGNEIPKTAHVAMLTALEHFEIKEYPMPEVGDGDILVKVEGCGVCGTDAHEFMELRKQPGCWLRSSHSLKECVIAHWSSDSARKI